MNESDVYPKLAEEEQCHLYNSLGLLACASAGTLVEVSSRDNNGIQHSKCSHCDDNLKHKNTAPIWEGPESEEAVRAVAKLIKLPKTQKYRRPRVAAMLALRRLLCHSANADHLNLATSPFGQWCLQALRSSIRELRIAAGLVRVYLSYSLITNTSRRTLTIFLQAASVFSDLPNNSLVTLDFLRSLSDQSDLSLQETCILTWGQIAR